MWDGVGEKGQGLEVGRLIGIVKTGDMPWLAVSGVVGGHFVRSRTRCCVQDGVFSLLEGEKGGGKRGGAWCNGDVAENICPRAG